ncbi:MAG: tyrosine-type recombinase/integrase [Phycisphaeraceae bacterium]
MPRPAPEPASACRPTVRVGRQRVVVGFATPARSHRLRTTFGTHLAVAGVHPRVAQAAMPHSRMELTNTYYTDSALLDVAGP